MFSPTEEMSRTPRTWRSALHRAAGLVVAFATLDSIQLEGAPHGSSDAAAAEPHPHHHREALRAPARRRGHGTAPRAVAACVGAPAPRRDAGTSDTRQNLPYG